MKFSFILRIIFWIVICEFVGILGSIFTAPSIPTWYATLIKPSFSPPNWIFGPVWTILYAMMGVTAARIWNTPGKKAVIAKRWFLIQLGLNFLWSILFFGLKNPTFAFVGTFFLWISIGFTIKFTHRHSKVAAYLLIPYLLWVTFASALNASIALLN